MYIYINICIFTYIYIWMYVYIYTLLGILTLCECIYVDTLIHLYAARHTMGWLRLVGSILLQNFTSFMGLFCKKRPII